MNTYIDNCKKYKKEIIQNFSPAQVVENFFTTEEVEILSEYQFANGERIKWTPTSNNIQSVVDIDTMFESISWLETKFQTLLGDYWINHTGNFYITTQLHDCHVDLLTEDELTIYDWTHKVIPWKSVVIPLMLSHNAETYTAFLKQRHIGNSITIDRDYVSEQNDSMYELARDHPTFYLEDGTVSKHDDKLESDDYIFPQIGKKTLQGLEIENCFKFEPGDIFLFDACQLHASCASNVKPNERFLKSGINIQFYKEII